MDPMTSILLAGRSLPVRTCPLSHSLEAICVTIAAQSTWITRGAGLRARCTRMAFQVLKLLNFTSFEDTEVIPWDKIKETLLRSATAPPPLTSRICFLLEYKGLLTGVGSRNDHWFYVDVQGSP